MLSTDVPQTGGGRAGLRPPLEVQNNTLCRDSSVGGNSEHPVPGGEGSSPSGSLGGSRGFQAVLRQRGQEKGHGGPDCVLLP